MRFNNLIEIEGNDETVQCNLSYNIQIKQIGIFLNDEKTAEFNAIIKN